LDPAAFGAWIGNRIRILKADPDPEGVKKANVKGKMNPKRQIYLHEKYLTH
jgi:hypothetical protein